MKLSIRKAMKHRPNLLLRKIRSWSFTHLGQRVNRKGRSTPTADSPSRPPRIWLLVQMCTGGDVIYWMTDMGWMMGPWLVFGALILGSTLCIYDGAPDYPGSDRLWDLVEKHKITQLGVSPTLVRSLIPYGEEHFKKHDLSSLKFFAST